MNETNLNSFNKLKEHNSENTLTLLLPFIEKLKNDRDKQEYISAFLNYCSITKSDLLNTDVRAVDKYLSTMAERVHSHNCAESTRRKHRRIISAFYHMLDQQVESGNSCIPSSYRNNLDLFGKEYYDDEDIKHSTVPTISDMDALIGEARKTDEELLITILLAYQTYLKTGEMAKIKISDLCYNSDDSNTCILTVKRHGEDKNIAVPAELAKLIENFLDRQDEETCYLFCTPDSADSWIRLQQLHLKKLCAKCFGDRSFSFNDIRLAAGNTAINLGNSELSVADAMGYSTSRHIRRLSSLRTDVITEGFLNIKVVNI